VLAIETTGRTLSVAWSRGNASDGERGGEIVCRRSESELNHLTYLIPTVKDILESEGAALSSLGAVAVSAGPGSFTGARIGVSAARALAQVTGLPVIKVPTLETFVYGYEPGDIVCPVLDARRGQIYSGAYRLSNDGGSIETLVPGAARDPEVFDAMLDAALAAERERGGREGASFRAPRGNAEEPYPRVRERSAAIRRVRDEDEPQSAAKVLKWALAFGAPVDYTELEPLYLRKAEAQRKLDERRQAEQQNPGKR
jgi:tRNA threonylcarbamoyladenosine biosynthesis protein TsaB